MSVEPEVLDRTGPRPTALWRASCVLSACALVGLVAGLAWASGDHPQGFNPLMMSIAGILALPAAVPATALALRARRRLEGERSDWVLTLATLAVVAAVWAAAPLVLWLVVFSVAYSAA